MRYCLKCGEEIPNSAKFCPGCGSAIKMKKIESTTNSNTVNRSVRATIPASNDTSKAVAVVMIMCIMALISPFCKMFYIEFFDITEFSTFGILRDVVGYMRDAESAYDGFIVDDILESIMDIMDSEMAIVFIASIVDVILMITSVVKFIQAISNFTKDKSDSQSRCLKCMSECLLFAFLSHLLFFVFLMYINMCIMDEFNFSEPCGGTGLFYFFEIVFVIGVIITNRARSLS